MNKEEFLEILSIQLEGEIPSNEISQHITYYNHFINQKILQGKPEEDVINELGDPRLIAKNLIHLDTSKATHTQPKKPGRKPLLRRITLKRISTRKHSSHKTSTG